MFVLLFFLIVGLDASSDLLFIIIYIVQPTVQ